VVWFPASPTPQSLLPQSRQTWPRIRVEVLLRERLWLADSRAVLAFGGQVEARSEVLKRFPVVPTSRYHRAEHR